MAVYSVPAGQPAAVTLAVLDPVTGAPANLAAAPTVTVRDGAGVSVDTGTATAVPATTGAYVYTIPAAALPAATLDVYEVSWAGVLGGGAYVALDVLATAGGIGRYFTTAELRDFDRSLADAVKYPPAKVEAARVYAEQRIEATAEVAFLPRGRRGTTDLSRRSRLAGWAPRPALLLPDTDIREVLGLRVDDVPWLPEDVTLDPSGGLVRVDGDYWHGASVVWWYAHGLDYPPEPIRAAGMTLARERLIPSTLPARATMQSTDVGVFRLSIADRGGSTGYPEVDAVCALYGRQRPHVG